LEKEGIIGKRRKKDGAHGVNGENRNIKKIGGKD